MQNFTHPTYTVKHSCGHTFEKQILEASEPKRRKVLKMMEQKPCIECILAASK